MQCRRQDELIEFASAAVYLHVSRYVWSMYGVCKDIDELQAALCT